MGECDFRFWCRELHSLHSAFYPRIQSENNVTVLTPDKQIDGSSTVSLNYVLIDLDSPQNEEKSWWNWNGSQIQARSEIGVKHSVSSGTNSNPSFCVYLCRKCFNMGKLQVSSIESTIKYL